MIYIVACGWELFFLSEFGARPLGGGTEYYRGFHQRIRPTQMGFSLNIDVASRAFYEPILVTEFISKHFNLDLSRPRALSDQDRVKIEKVLKGVKVKLSISWWGNKEVQGDRSLKRAAWSPNILLSINYLYRRRRQNRGINKR
ncbi:protein argonaute 5-like isoform X2 [Vicia villosa]|uniref:protein argonaute 5-like isoform X2 n=1 Tax=Vicia villosa TaxID=3911 RepID=UPI00273BABE4|nr:protein argonaute 5-like isoform X2 [Vicia villosa]